MACTSLTTNQTTKVCHSTSEDRLQYSKLGVPASINYLSYFWKVFLNSFISGMENSLNSAYTDCETFAGAISPSFRCCCLDNFEASSESAILQLSYCGRLEVNKPSTSKSHNLDPPSERPQFSWLDSLARDKLSLQSVPIFTRPAPISADSLAYLHFTDNYWLVGEGVAKNNSGRGSTALSIFMSCIPLPN